MYIVVVIVIVVAAATVGFRKRRGRMEVKRNDNNDRSTVYLLIYLFQVLLY